MALKEAILRNCEDGQKVLIAESPFDVGRNKAAKLMFTDGNIAQSHCQFSVDENQKWMIQDFSSSGTYINGELIGKGNSANVRNGDVVRFGPAESNQMWEFYTIIKEKGDGNNSVLQDDMEAQSQAIIDIAAQKNSLERRIIVHKETHIQIKNEREEFDTLFEEQIKSIELKYAKEWEELQNPTADIKQDFERRVKEDKEKILREADETSKYYQQKLNENDQLEEQLKQEVLKLEQRLEAEKKQWEENFLEEKKKIEEKLSSKENEFEQNEKRWEDKLNKEEQEKNSLMLKLQEMEKAQNLLQEKLKETNEQHLLEKAKVEEEMLKEKKRQEEKLKEETERSLKGSGSGSGSGSMESDSHEGSFSYTVFTASIVLKKKNIDLGKKKIIAFLNVNFMPIIQVESEEQFFALEAIPLVEAKSMMIYVSDVKDRSRELIFVKFEEKDFNEHSEKIRLCLSRKDSFYVHVVQSKGKFFGQTYRLDIQKKLWTLNILFVNCKEEVVYRYTTSDTSIHTSADVFNLNRGDLTFILISGCKETLQQVISDGPRLQFSPFIWLTEKLRKRLNVSARDC